MADFEEGANILQTQELERERDISKGTASQKTSVTGAARFCVCMQTEGMGVLAAGDCLQAGEGDWSSEALQPRYSQGGEPLHSCWFAGDR